MMLVHGTCNPIGEAECYNGVYLKDSDIKRIVAEKELINKPVLVEHEGNQIGTVVSAWQHDGKLDILVDVNNESFESCVARSFVASNCLRDFSLGYKVCMSMRDDSQIDVVDVKKVVEVSL
eukprot:3932252-Rhodomonas_salina.1